MEEINLILDALTSLIEVNNKRMKVYQSLAEKMHHSELKSLFRHYAEQSNGFSQELSTWRSAYGGFQMPQKNGRGIWAQAAYLLDHWFSKKVALKCEETEMEALKVYRTVMQKSILPADAAKDVDRQSREFNRALSRLRTLQSEGTSKGSAGAELTHTHVAL